MLRNDIATTSTRITWEGCSVLLDVNDGDRLVFARLSPAAKLKIGNKNCSLQPLIGCSYGSLFQLETGPNGPYLSRSIASDQEGRDSQLNVESRDNRSLIDNNSAQGLSGEDIEAMRRQGATGDEIIEALIANSTTFEKKTSFSQVEAWKDHRVYHVKQKKYAPKVLLRCPVVRRFLRGDALSLILSMANVSSNSDILVVDVVGGLLTGAVAEPLGGTGFVCNSYLGQIPYAMDIVKIFNFSEEICERTSILVGIVSASLVHSGIHPKDKSLAFHSANCKTRSFIHYENRLKNCTISVSDLLSQKESSEQILQHDGVCNMESQTNDQMSLSVNVEAISLSSGNKVSDPGAKSTMISATRVYKSTKAGEKSQQEMIDSWKENGFSSLIIAAPELDTWTLVKDLIPLLSNSASFAIYHQYLQPLATCMHNLQIGKMAIGLQISEPWLREYQVLPSRTHPCMQMSAFGGYILSGTKICSS